MFSKIATTGFNVAFETVKLSASSTPGLSPSKGVNAIKFKEIL